MLLHSSTKHPFPLAILLSLNAYAQSIKQPIGRLSAGEGWLEAYLRFSGNQDHCLVVPSNKDASWFHEKACKFNAKANTHAFHLAQWGQAANKSGAFLLPGPGIDEWAWKRMPWGDGQASLIGLVHTLCSRNVQWGLGQFMSSPVRNWDALICTSHASRSVVEGFLNRQEYWYRKRFDAKKFERPQLPIIPLGVHPEVWAPPENDLAKARTKSREELRIPQDALVVLLAGRLDALTKNHPGASFKMLGELQQRFSKLRVLIYGEAPNEIQHDLWEKGIEVAAPGLPVHWIPGSERKWSAAVRWAADIFLSLSDNPQETFGITPLEAMAASLPCVVSDWDGYRDTVIQPNESSQPCGFRIATSFVEGLGKQQAHKMLQQCINYDQAVGQISQGIAIDIPSLRKNLIQLLEEESLRKSMGQNGRARILEKYSWKIIISQWQELIQELASIRNHAINQGSNLAPQMPSWLPSTDESFEPFVSEKLDMNRRLYWSGELQGLTSARREELIRNRLLEPLEGWSSDGVGSSIEAMANDPQKLPARAKGWLIKQGWLQK